jgi:hypothetical protein
VSAEVFVLAPTIGEPFLHEMPEGVIENALDLVQEMFWL